MIGRMDRRVTFIQKIVETGDSNEDKITGWEEIENEPTVWAQKMERSGNTFVQNDRVTFSQQTDWNIRFRTDLKVSPSMRLVYGGQVYDILNISEVSDQPRKRVTRLNTTLLDNIYFS